MSYNCNRVSAVFHGNGYVETDGSYATEGVLLSPVYLNLQDQHIKEMPIKYLNTVLKMKNFDKNQIKKIKMRRRKMKIRDYAEINKMRTVLSDRKFNDELRILVEEKRSLETKRFTLEEEIKFYKGKLNLEISLKM